MSADLEKYKIYLPKEGFWAKAPMIFGGIGVLGALLAATGLGDMDRFGYSYLFAFAVIMTFMAGALWFLVALYITGGQWAITSRRIAEAIAWPGSFVVAGFGLVFLGLVACGQFDLYDEWRAAHHGAEHGEHGAVHDEGHGEGPDAEGEGHEAAPHEEADEAHGDEHGALLLGRSVAHAQEHGEHAAPAHTNVTWTATPQMEQEHHHLLAIKAPYLNQARWLIFGVLYFVVWIAIAWFFVSNSMKQDEKKDYYLALKMRRWSPLAAVGFGLSLTFAAFDWLMSLEAAWYSTIFGVVIFAGSAVSIFALMILFAIPWYEQGITKDAITVEHLHDHGKLLFAFMCFWAYTSFSQWMLIWYAGIPEEAVWFHLRWNGGWNTVSLALMFGHFVLPFFFLISRIIKRRLQLLRLGAAWLIVMHIIDMYFYVLPQAGALQISLADFGALLLMVGVFFAAVTARMQCIPLLPFNDPIFQRSLAHHQTQ